MSENTLVTTIFPNPANHNAIITTSKVISSGNILLFDQTGKLVWSKLISEQTNNIKINTSELSRGIYTIQVESSGAFAQPSKLVVVH